MNGHWKQWRAARLILELFQQGISVEKIAGCLVLGLLLGIFPVLGSTTFLCALAGVLFRLNLPLIQLVNYLVYPLQLLLLLPFWGLGQRFFGGKALSLSMPQLIQMIRDDPWSSIARLWIITLEGIGAWGIVAIPLGLGFYASFVFLLRRLMKGKLKNA